MNYLLAFCLFISISSAAALARAENKPAKKEAAFYFCDTSEEIIFDWSKEHSIETEGKSLSFLCQKVPHGSQKINDACKSATQFNCDN